MAAASPIATPYQLPYSVHLPPPPLWRDGGTVQLSVELPAEPSADQIEELGSLVSPLCLLAQAGALCGDTVSPAMSTIEDEDGPRPIGRALQWTLTGCRVDERAAVLFAHLFLLAEDCPVVRLEMRKLQDHRPSRPLPCDPDLEHPYPPRWPELPFPVDVDPDAETDTRNFEIQFRKTITDEQAAGIDARLQDWGLAGLCGLYPPAPVEPFVPGMLPDEELIVMDNVVEWSVKKFRAHEDAIEGFINVCAAIHFHVAPVASLRVE